MRLRYAARIWPATPTLVPLALGAVWAVASRLDTPLERTVLVVATTIGSSCAFADPAATVTASVPTSLRRRVVPPGLLAVTTGLAGWLLLRIAAAGSTAVGRPGRDDLLEWLVVASTQVAVGLAIARRRDTVSIGPGAAVAAVWAALAGFPELHPHVYAVGDHLAIWLGVFVGAVVVAVVATSDPADKPFDLVVATGGVSEQRSPS